MNHYTLLKIMHDPDVGRTRRTYATHISGCNECFLLKHGQRECPIGKDLKLKLMMKIKKFTSEDLPLSTLLGIKQL